MPVLDSWEEYELIYGDSNLITNGNFPDNVDGWIVASGSSIDWRDGRAFFSQESSYKSAKQIIAVTSGETYQLSADVNDGTVSGRVFASDSTGKQSGVIRQSNPSVLFTPNSDSITVYFGGLSGAGECSFDDIKLTPV